ncbi:hypothetical protein MTO96_042402, partial [Rhipicephalus appendiculatus]
MGDGSEPAVSPEEPRIGDVVELPALEAPLECFSWCWFFGGGGFHCGFGWRSDSAHCFPCCDRGSGIGVEPRV